MSTQIKIKLIALSTIVSLLAVPAGAFAGHYG
jgi:hypothetical protein